MQSFGGQGEPIFGWLIYFRSQTYMANAKKNSACAEFEKLTESLETMVTNHRLESGGLMKPLLNHIEMLNFRRSQIRHGLFHRSI
jgi:hypothetical protein